MNRIYRLVWNKSLACLVPAAEMKRRRGKSSGGARTAGALAVAAALSSWVFPAHGQEITLLNLQNVQPEPYTFYSFTFTADLAQTYLTFQFRQDPAYWSLDDVSVTPIGSSTQLITNGAFANGSTANSYGQQVPNSWTLIGQAGLEAGGTVNSGCGTTGGYCWYDGSVGGVDGLFQSFATPVGSSYTLSFWLANSGGPTNEAVVQAGASEDVGGMLVPPPVLTNIILAGSPYLAAGLGTTLNPVFDGGTLQLDTSGPTFSEAFTVNSTNGTIDTAGLTSTMSGVLSGPGGLTFMNSGSGGSLTLTNTNTYQGASTINNSATVALSGTGGIADSSGVADNGTFNISGTSAGASIQSLSGNGAVTLGSNTLKLSNADGTFAGSISGTGGFAVTGGTETLSGSNGYTGATTISSGATLALSGTGSIANSSVVSDLGTFNISGTTAGASVQSLSGNGTVALGAQTLTLTNANDMFAGVIGGSGGVAITGGTETLSGTNTYTGGTSIGSGTTLALSGTGSIASSSSVADNGTFDISGTTAGASVQSLSGNGTVALGAQSLTLTNANSTFAGVIGGTGGLTVSGGTETLSGINAYSGGTTVSTGGTLVVASDTALGAATGALALNNGTLLTTATFNTSRNVTLTGDGTIDVSAGTDLTDSIGTISGSGALIKSGSGTLSLCGSVSNTGGTSVTAGALDLCGSDTGTGSTSIGSGATLALSGASSIASSSGVVDNGIFDVSGSSAGASVQTLSGNGTVALGAQSLTLTNANDTFAGIVAGTGGIAVSGGTETLSGTNTYTGGTSVSGGARVIVAADAALGNASGGLTLNNGTLEATASFTTARNLSLVGNATFDTDPGVSLMQTGQISGNGHVTKDGDGTLVLAGDNRDWGQQGNNSVGGITIDDGLVEVTNPYGLGYGLVALNSGVIATTVNIVTGQTILIAGDTVLNTDAGTTTTLTGTVETDGTGSCFQKTGPGTLVMSGVTTLSNGTCLEDGRIEANGTLNSIVTVSPGAILRGTGTITGAVMVRGTLAPGNSPGTLTTTASVTMAAGSTYQEDINGTGVGTGPGNYSRLLIAGPNSQFTASGATLDVNLLNITGTVPYTPYTPAVGNSFSIVSADGGIVGRFAAFDQPDGLASGTRLVAFYDTFGGNSIDLRVVPTSYAGYLQGRGANSNAQSVGSALDQILAADQAGHANATQDELAYAVSGLNAAELPRVMSALTGEVHADVAAVAPQADQWLQGSVARELDVGDAADSGERQPGDALWLDSTANKGKWSEDSQSSGFTANRMQIAFGFDLLMGQPNRLGVGFSHSLTDVSTAAGYGSVEENTGFIYGQYSLSPLLIDGMFGGGDSRWATSRADPLNFTPNSLTANAHGDNSLASVGVRWPWHISGLVLAPYVRALWQRTARDGFSEGSTPDALSGPGYDATGLRSTVGISGGSESQSPLAALLTYQFNLGVAHDSAALAQSVVQSSLAGAAIATDSPEIGRTFVLANITGTARLGKRTYVYLGLSGEARSGKSEDAGFNAGIRTRF
jgi:fibronectin-binding autotransporter adhesin